MDARKILEQRRVTLRALQGGGISRGFGSADEDDDLQTSLQAQWETERHLLDRVLREPGDPMDHLWTWRERTQGFLDKYPEREGWTDRDGRHWHAESVLETIDKLLDDIESWEEADDFEDYDEDEEAFEDEF